MYRFAWVVLALSMVGCGGDDKDGGPPTEDTGNTPDVVPVDFITMVDAGKVDGTINADAVRAHEVAETLSAAVGLVISDLNVQAILNNDNGLGSNVTKSPPCWGYVGVTRPTEVTMDYTSCFDWGIEGGAFVRDHPAGPVLFDFKNLKVGGREVVGTLALAGLESPNGWRVYESDGITPTLDNRVPMGLTIDGYTSGVRFEGSVSVERDTLSSTLWQWGQITIEDAYSAVSMLQGTTTPETLDPTIKPDQAEAAAIPMTWLNCRCPVGGALQYDATWTATQVEVDIDDLKLTDDGFDDPVILIDVNLPVSATATLSAEGCGEWVVDWPLAGDVTHQLTGQQLYSLIELQCTTLAIDNRDHCDALLKAAQAVDAIDIRIGEAKLSNQASNELERSIDSGFCIVPEP